MPPKRKPDSDVVLTRAVERVVVGGERAAIVGREQDIPYRTLLKYVARRRRGESAVPKRRGPSPALTEAEEQHILRWMRELQAAGLPVRRRELLMKANEAVKSQTGTTAELSDGWYTRFRDRHPEISGSGTHMVIAEVGGQEVEEVDQEEQVQQLQRWKSREQLEKEQLLTSPVEKAVFTIQESYADKWPPQDVVDAFDLMLDTQKADLFVVMVPGELRDMWLKKQLRMQRAVK